MVRSGTSSRTTMSDAAYDAANQPLAIHHFRPRSLRRAQARSAATTYGATQNGHSASTDHSVPSVISTYFRRTKDIGGQWSLVTSRVARAAATTPTVAAATAVSGSFCMRLLLGGRDSTPPCPQPCLVTRGRTPDGSRHHGFDRQRPRAAVQPSGNPEWHGQVRGHVTHRQPFHER